MRKQTGFSMVEIAAAIGIMGALAAASGIAYFNYLPKYQLGEALGLMDAEKAKMNKFLLNGSCTGPNSGAQGKYGTLTVSGTYNARTQNNCPTGCQLTYTANAASSSRITNKILRVNVLSSGVLSNDASATTVDARYIPKLLTSIVVPSNVQCQLTSPEGGANLPSITNPPAVSGSVTGGQTPPTNGGGNGDNGGGNGDNGGDNGGNTGGGNSGNNGETGETGGTGGTNNPGTPSTTPTPFTNIEDARDFIAECPQQYTKQANETVLYIYPKTVNNSYRNVQLSTLNYDNHPLFDRVYTASGFIDNKHRNITDRVDLLQYFKSETGRDPVANEKITFIVPCKVTVVSNKRDKPVIYGGGFPSSVDLMFFNFGSLISYEAGFVKPHADYKTFKGAHMVHGSNHSRFRYKTGTSHDGYKLVENPVANPVYTDATLKYFAFGYEAVQGRGFFTGGSRLSDPLELTYRPLSSPETQTRFPASRFGVDSDYRGNMKYYDGRGNLLVESYSPDVYNSENVTKLMHKEARAFLNIAETPDGMYTDDEIIDTVYVTWVLNDPIRMGIPPLNRTEANAFIQTYLTDRVTNHASLWSPIDATVDVGHDYNGWISVVFHNMSEYQTYYNSVRNTDRDNVYYRVVKHNLTLAQATPEFNRVARFYRLKFAP